MYFSTNPGKLEITPSYADNELYLQELKFSVPASEWSEFQKSQLYRSLVEYVNGVCPQIQDMRTENCAPEYILEIEDLNGSSSRKASFLSLLALIRKLFHCN